MTDANPTAASATPPRKITCPQYEPLPGKRHCRHFIQGGTCALPDHFLCSEWAAVNGHRLPVARTASSGEATSGMAGRGEAGSGEALQGKDLHHEPKDLFGNPVAEKPAPKAATRSLPIASADSRATESTVASESTPAIDVDQLRGFTNEDIASFKALGVEVCLHSEAYGELWLVPAYTGGPRKEITPEHAATVMRVLSVFPGSRVTAFEKTTPGEPVKESEVQG